MAVTNTPAWPQTPRYAVAGVSTANTNTDGTGTITSLITAGSDGTVITGLYAGATVTVTATSVRFFLSIDAGSTWTYLPHLDSLVEAHTVAATTANDGRVTIIDQSDPAKYMVLPANAVLGFTTAVTVSGGTMNAEAVGADY